MGYGRGGVGADAAHNRIDTDVLVDIFARTNFAASVQIMCEMQID